MFRFYSIIFALIVMPVQADLDIRSRIGFFENSSLTALVKRGLHSSVFGSQYAIKAVPTGGKPPEGQPDVTIYLNDKKPEVSVRAEIFRSKKEGVLDAVFKKTDKESGDDVELWLKYTPDSNKMTLILSGRRIDFYTSGKAPDFSDKSTLSAHMVDPATMVRIENIQNCYRQLGPLRKASPINVTCDGGVLQSVDGMHFIFTALEPLYLPKTYQKVVSTKQEGATYALGASHTLEFDGDVGCRQLLDLLFQPVSFRSCASGGSTQSGGGGGSSNGAAKSGKAGTSGVTIVVYEGRDKFGGSGGDGKKPPGRGDKLKSGHELPVIPKSKKNKQRGDKRGFNSGAHKKQNASRK